MKLIGAAILMIGLGLGIYALTMSVGVEVPSKVIAFGITTPAVTIADPQLLSQRHNYLIFSGILAIAGAIVLGMATIGKRK